MPFPVTDFNLLGNVWDAGHTPAANPADHVAQPFQWYNSPHELHYFRLQSITPAGPFAGFLTLLKYNALSLPIAQSMIIQPDSAVLRYFIVVLGQEFYYGFPQWFSGAWCFECNNVGAAKYNYQ